MSGVCVHPCGYSHPSDMARRARRFDRTADPAYVAKSGGPEYPTRQQAVDHECQTQHHGARDTTRDQP